MEEIFRVFECVRSLRADLELGGAQGLHLELGGAQGAELKLGGAQGLTWSFGGAQVSK